MNAEQFYNYIIENFELDGTARNLIHNAICYATKYRYADDQRDVIRELLDGIGLLEDELEMICF